MKSSFKYAMVLAGVMVLMVLSHAASAAKVQSIVPYGEDGDAEFFQVVCSDKNIGSVVVHDKPRQICAHPAWNEKKCQTVWSVKGAAAYACQ